MANINDPSTIKHIIDENHYNYLKEKFWEFMENGYLTDIKIITDKDVNYEKKVHSIILQCFCKLSYEGDKKNIGNLEKTLMVNHTVDMIEFVINLLYFGKCIVPVTALPQFMDLANILKITQISVYDERGSDYFVYLMHHKQKLLNYLCYIKKNDINCDMNIAPLELKCFPIHSSILAAYSKKFFHCFRNRIKETNPVLLFLPLNGEMIALTLELCYFGQVTFADSNSNDLAMVANFLGMERFIEKCKLARKKCNLNDENDFRFIKPPLNSKPEIIDKIQQNNSHHYVYLWTKNRCYIFPSLCVQLMNFLSNFDDLKENQYDIIVFLKNISNSVIKKFILFLYNQEFSSEVQLLIDLFGLKCPTRQQDIPSAEYATRAYHFYIESLSLIAEVLKKDSVSEDSTLTLRDKWHLIEFAKQSLSRVSFILRKQGPIPDGRAIDNPPLSPSAPAETNFHINSLPVSPLRDCELSEDPIMMARYQRRIELAASALEKHNIELEMARQFVEKAANNRNRLVRATAWAMQHAHKKFQIQEKLHGGRLRESDLRKQQLYAVSLQFGEGNVWLTQLHQDLALYPNNEKMARELLDNVLTDSSHPIKASIDSMQNKVNTMITNAMINEKCESQPQLFVAICKVVQEDIGVVNDVLKALFEPLKTERNSIITSEAIHHVYFSQVKPAMRSLIREIHKDVVEGLKTRMENEYEEIKADLSEESKEAVTKLHYLTTLHNPYDMLDCTVHIIKLLATSKFDKGHFTSIGADDLLPRLCQVLVASCLPTICAEAYFMEAFMPSEKALGEEGYAVTMLQSAIAHLTMA